MDIKTLISDLEKHDTTTRVSPKEFKDYAVQYQGYIAALLIIIAVVSWLVLSSLTSFLLLVLLLLISFCFYVQNRETIIQNMIFADRHGLLWRQRARVRNLGFNGVVFNIGHSARSLNSFSSFDLPLNFGVYHYRFTTGSGKNKKDHDYTVAYFDLPKELPHILLDSKNNNGLLSSSIPRFLDKDYEVSLEGDFDQHFSLYTAFPKPAEALTIISPDVMQTLIDETPEVDIEIVNKQLWVYIPRQTSYAAYAKALKAGLAVLDSARSNVKHYKMQDLRLLASQETNRRKLTKKRFTIGSVLVILYLLYIFLVFSGNFSLI
ncbi:TPA: hypothetical protein EYO12_03475 [Candidatus Saccharibacteria bacterium]|nr:hypothetical protein [Candidatus Saccharibacteria bacterium]HIO87908.1 hypothetical protein [Candidatus Saccharibacteria bacterium]